LKHSFLKILLSLGLGLALLSSSSPWNVPSPSVDLVPADCGQPVDEAWAQKVSGIRWVAYSSPSRTGSSQPSEEAIYADLMTLKQAGFSGLITYGASGVMGRPFLTIAQELGYEGIILGLWSPTNKAEFNNALRAADLPIVLGYNIGNEGLSERRDRYALTDLCAAISSLRAATGKPVATSEDIDTYYRRPALLGVGDWVFTIAHPYWHWTKYPREAVQWEQEQYAALQARTGRFIFLKEVGLPSDGAYGLSETGQDQYYRELAKTDVPFAYFEGFDQPSKAYNSVEPHWGLFHADMSPKLAAWNLMGLRQFTAQEMDALLGRDRDGTVYQPLISFDTLTLPDDALLTSVKLKIRVEQVVGFDPLKNGQRLVVDICRSLPGRIPSLNCESGAGTLAKSLGDGWYVLEFDADALQSIQWTGSPQFRLRLEGPGNKAVPRSYFRLDEGDADGVNSPILVLRYGVE
jgi:exo-beta-1,3-glucanase (GH17 family)